MSRYPQLPDPEPYWSPPREEMLAYPTDVERPPPPPLGAPEVPCLPSTPQSQGETFSRYYPRGNPSSPTLSLGSRQGVALEWRDITYAVTIKQGKEKVEKLLLSGVSGKARPGQILAIMGGSGAGKTTLLDALAGRLVKGVDGKMFVNGVEMPPGSTGGFSKAYVLQGDNLHPVLTVREVMSFAANFYLDTQLSSADRREVVDHWLELLGLQSIENVKIGDDEKKGISGGQKRRVSIGVDMLRDPKVIFLDEPISGLDSTSAYKVMHALSDITINDTRTLLLTIHQPSPRILSLLDNIVVLCDGKVVFQGGRDDVEPFLLESQKVQVPDHVCPLEFCLDFVDEAREGNSGAVAEMAELQLERFRQTAILTPENPGVPTTTRTSHLRDYFTLTHRTALVMLRTPELFIARLVFLAVSGFLFSTVFWNLGSSWQDSASILGFFLMGVAMLSFTSVEVMPLFASERFIIRREYFQGAYAVPSYILAQATVWTVSIIPGSLLFTLCSYWSVGLDTDTNGWATFLFTWLIWFCVMVSANAFAMMFSALILCPMTAASSATGAFAFMLLLAGFFIPRADIPAYWIWFHYLSHFGYGLFGLGANYFSNMPDTAFGCPPPNQDNPNCTLTGQEILAYYDMDGWQQWISVGALLALTVLWRIIHCVVLHLRFRKLRPRA